MLIETMYSGKGFPISSIVQAVSQADHFDVINLSGSIFTEEISINKSLIINGQSPLLTIVQAAKSPYTATTSVFKINENCYVTLRNMTIRHGNNDGGIENRGRLWIEKCAIVQNQSNFKEHPFFSYKKDPSMSAAAPPQRSILLP